MAVLSAGRGSDVTRGEGDNLRWGNGARRLCSALAAKKCAGEKDAGDGVATLWRAYCAL